ncbi:MAG TPA: molybdenum cofactor guanylyltransferase [Syntrophomonas sp.]|nr:molybdenum cofactor guanylyltransferase [Syntrophomonas sp.]
MEASGIILAGGRSSRMGRDKTLMPVEAETMIERTVRELRQVTGEIIIASNQNEKYNLPDTLEVPDIFPGHGPLGGIHAGLKASHYPYAFVVAGDMPLFTADLAAYFLTRAQAGFDVVAPQISGSWEPLCAVYARSCLPAIERHLAAGIRQVFQFYKEVRVLKIDEQELDAIGKTGESFYNLNTPEDYQALLDRQQRGRPNTPG